jgi:hypothetical protein
MMFGPRPAPPYKGLFNVLNDTGTGRAGILTAIQVGRLIVFHWGIVRREQVRVVRGQIFICRVRSLASIANRS